MTGAVVHVPLESLEKILDAPDWETPVTSQVFLIDLECPGLQSLHEEPKHSKRVVILLDPVDRAEPVVVAFDGERHWDVFARQSLQQHESGVSPFEAHPC